MTDWLPVVGGFLFGGVCVCSVSYVYLTRQRLNVSGASLALIGFALVGISTWSGAEFNVGQLRIKLEREQQRSAELSEQKAELTSTLVKQTNDLVALKARLVRLPETDPGTAPAPSELFGSKEIMKQLDGAIERGRLVETQSGPAR